MDKKQDIEGKIKGEVTETMFHGHGPMSEVGEPVGGDEIELFVEKLPDIRVNLVERIGGVSIARDDDIA